MDTNDALAALDAHQVAVLAALDHALDLSRCPPETVRIDLAKARWDLVRRARAYQLFKHSEVFDPGILAGPPAQAAVARRMKAACLAAGTAVEDHAVDWMGKDLVAEWPAYHAALLALAAALRAHVAAERRDIATFLAGSVRTPRYAAAG